MRKASELIREARNILFERGWYQGDFSPVDSDAPFNYVPNAPLCVLGALTVAEFGRIDENLYPKGECYLMLALSPRANWDDPASDVAEWNDTSGRKFDEVVDLFDRAEKLAEIDEAKMTA